MSDTKMIYERMAEVMAGIGWVGKDKKNQQQGFMFRGIDDVYNVLHGIMAKHQVFTTSEIVSQERSERSTKNGGVIAFLTCKIRYTFWTVDGSSMTTEVIGEAMDSGDKASNKAMSVAHKYALLQAFMVPTKEMADADSDAYELADISELAAAIEAIESSEDMQSLQSAFADAWKSYPAKDDRKRLTAAKDKRKKELQS